MIAQQIKHEQLFLGENAHTEATAFLTESAKEHPDFEYYVQFQEDGILITGQPK